MKALTILAVIEIFAMVLLMIATFAGIVEVSVLNATELLARVATTLRHERVATTLRHEEDNSVGALGETVDYETTTEEEVSQVPESSDSNSAPGFGQAVSRANVLESQNRRLVFRSSMTKETQDNGSADVTEPPDDVDEANQTYETTWRRGVSAELVWSRHLKMDGDQYIAYTIVDSYGHIVAVGSSYDPSGGKLSEFYFVKFDSYGNVIAERSFGTPGRDYLGSIIEAEDGYIAVGFTSRTSNGAKDIYVAKLNYDGDVIWEKLYGTSGEDRAEFITYSSNGGYLICGSVSENAVKRGDYFIMEIDENGDIKWDRVFDLGGDETAYCVREDTDGYVVCGVGFYNGNQEGFVVKHDYDFNVQWRQMVQGPREDSLFSIAEPTQDGYVLVGEKSTLPNVDYPYVVKFSKSGVKLWERVINYEGGGALVSVIRDQNSYIIAGKLAKGTLGSSDGYVAWLSEGGAIEADYVIGGQDKDHFNHLAFSNSNTIILAGWTKSFDAIERDPYLVKVTYSR